MSYPLSKGFVWMMRYVFKSLEIDHSEMTFILCLHRPEKSLRTKMRVRDWDLSDLLGAYTIFEHEVLDL